MSDQPNWDAALMAAGFIDQRSGKRGSWSRLAERIGVHTSTLTAMADGTKETETSTVNDVAEALNLDPRVVSGWVGRARAERAPFKPHGDADLLDKDERAAINRLIQLLARDKKRGQHGEGTTPAEKSGGDGGTRSVSTPADDDAATVSMTDAVVPAAALAARHGRSSGKQMDADLEKVGEDNQDVDGDV